MSYTQRWFFHPHANSRRGFPPPLNGKEVAATVIGLEEDQGRERCCAGHWRDLSSPGGCRGALEPCIGATLQLSTSWIAPGSHHQKKKSNKRALIPPPHQAGPLGPIPASWQRHGGQGWLLEGGIPLSTWGTHDPASHRMGCPAHGRPPPHGQGGFECPM